MSANTYLPRCGVCITYTRHECNALYNSLVAHSALPTSVSPSSADHFALQVNQHITTGVHRYNIITKLK